MAASSTRVENTNIRKIDRISSLPEDVRIHIISFLPTKCSICTGVLSRNWRNLWKFVPTIIIIDNPQPKVPKCTRSQSKLSELNNHVYEFDYLANKLLLHYNYCVERICLHSQVGRVLIPLNFDSWIEAAIRRQVRELDISLCQPPIPLVRLLSLCSSQTLEVLKLCANMEVYTDHVFLVGMHHQVLHVMNQPTPPFSFDRLKVLHLRMMKPAIMQMIYSSCPILQELVLDFVLTTSNKGTYKISVPTLKALTIRCRSLCSLKGTEPESFRLSEKYEPVDLYYEFQIGCPALESLHIVGPELLYNVVNLPFRKGTADLVPYYYFKGSTPFAEILSASANNDSPYLSVELQMTTIMSLFMSGSVVQ